MANLGRRRARPRDEIMARVAAGGPATSSLPRSAVVLSDNREPWWPPTAAAHAYYSRAVALASYYARQHCYDLRIYKLQAREGPNALACSHPRYGPRHRSWCKLVAVHHTLWARHEDGSFVYKHVLFMDSDLFWRDTSRSIDELLREFGDASGDASSTFAWFATNLWRKAGGREEVHGLQAHEKFDLKRPGHSHANAAFFILRNGDRARRFVTRWWSYDWLGRPHWQRTFSFRPWFEQVSLSFMWPVPGCALLNGSEAGPWVHMLKPRHEGAVLWLPVDNRTPTVHMDSSNAKDRNRIAESLWRRRRKAAFLLSDASRFAAGKHACAAGERPPALILTRVPRNFSSDLERAPPVGEDWFALPSNQGGG